MGWFLASICEVPVRGCYMHRGLPVHLMLKASNVICQCNCLEYALVSYRLEQNLNKQVNLYIWPHMQYYRWTFHKKRSKMYTKRSILPRKAFSKYMVPLNCRLSMKDSFNGDKFDRPNSTRMINFYQRVEIEISKQNLLNLPVIYWAKSSETSKHSQLSQQNE